MSQQSLESETPEVTRILAEYVLSSDFDSIPHAIHEEAIRALVNWVGCAVGGSRHTTLDVMINTLLPFAGAAQATVLGRNLKTDILTAALLNGTSSHVDDFDDTHLKTAIHPSGPVLSAILALAEHIPVTGKALLHAMILGIELECRVGNAIHPDHYQVGWHITGTAGVLGAAAASGRLLGLSTQQLCWALGIAATQASGLREMFGSMCKPFHVGHAAKNGLSAALLAQNGFTSSERGIEAPRGFAQVLSTKQDYTEITEGLGDHFELAINSYKPFPCGVVIHPILDGCLRLKQTHDFSATDIAKIELSVHPLVIELTGKTDPTTDLEGRFSVYHSAAAAIVRGKAGVDEYTDDAVNDPEIVALRQRVTAQINPSLDLDQTEVMISLTSGQTLAVVVDHALGSKDNPMTDTDIDTKTRDQCQAILGVPAVENMIATSRDVLALQSAAEIARAATPTP